MAGKLRWLATCEAACDDTGVLEGSKLQQRKPNMPHREQEGATYFVTFTRTREADVDLTTPSVARVIIRAMRYFAGERYLLFDYTVMPDHVHVVLKPLVCGGRYEPLARIMHSIKSWSANEVNRQLGRSGRLWTHKSYHHIVRGSKDYRTTATYIWGNPVKAGLIEDPAEWKWSGHGDKQHEGL